MCLVHCRPLIQFPLAFHFQVVAIRFVPYVEDLIDFTIKPLFGDDISVTLVRISD